MSPDWSDARFPTKIPRNNTQQLNYASRTKARDSSFPELQGVTISRSLHTQQITEKENPDMKRLLTLTGVIAVLLAALSLSRIMEPVSANGSIGVRDWKWCCNHSSHRRGTNPACALTETTYDTLRACRSRQRSHNNAYPSHRGSNGCR